MNRTYTVMLAVVLTVVIIAAVFMLSSNDKEEYPIVSGNEGLLGTASFEVADTEHSGTWVKGTAFAVDKGDRIQLKVIGELETNDGDSVGVLIETAVDEQYDDPLFRVMGAYSSWGKEEGMPILTVHLSGIKMIHHENMSAGGGTFAVDFGSTDRFDRSQGKIDLMVRAGQAHELVTIQLKNDS